MGVNLDEKSRGPDPITSSSLWHDVCVFVCVLVLGAVGLVIFNLLTLTLEVV